MKRNLLLLFLASGLIFSCSKDDKDDPQVAQNKIVGEWQVTELQIDDNTASDDAKFNRDVLVFLTERNCYILKFNFKADLTVIVENSENNLPYEEILTGSVFSCPTESETTMSTYAYDGAVLTIVDTEGETVLVDVTISGTTMTVDAADLNIEDFNDEGKLIFEKI